MDLFGFRYAEAVLDRDGNLLAEQAPGAVLDLARTSTDVLVMAGGGTATRVEDRRLYHALAARCADGLPRVAALGRRRIGLVGVLWPGRTIADDPFGRRLGADIGSGGAAAAHRLRELGAFVGDPQLVGTLAAADVALSGAGAGGIDGPALVDAIRGTLAEPCGRLGAAEEVPAALFTADSAELFDRLACPPPAPPPRSAVNGSRPPGPTGGPSRPGPTLPCGARNAAVALLDLAAHLVGTDRANTAARRGVAPLLAEIQAEGPRIHLAGHGLGARLVAAAAAAGADERTPRAPVASMTLVQAAVSHYGFAANWTQGCDGAFRACLSRGTVAGPILVTHTENDLAVGTVYAIADRLAGADPAGASDATGRFGGLGRDGARRTPEARAGTLLDKHAVYALGPGVLHNLRADRCISSHSAVTGAQVAHTLLSAVGWDFR